MLGSAIYVPEKRLLDDFKALNLLRHIPLTPARRIWKDLFVPPYFDVTLRLIDDLERQLSPHADQVVIARSVADLDRVLNQPDPRPVAFVHTVEGGHALGDDSTSDEDILKNLQTLFERGVALLTIAHFYPNRLVMPVFSLPEGVLALFSEKGQARLWSTLDLAQGLTPLGERVVERMAELGMLIDISHCTPVARRQVYEMINSMSLSARVVATHVGAYEINPAPYNLEDWEIRWIAEHGGFVGVIFMNYWLMPYATQLGLHYISRTIEQFVRAAQGRTDHIAIGTDFDGFTDPPDDIKDASEMPRLTEHLFAEGQSMSRRKYSDEDIENILGKNALRVLREGWGKKH